MIKYVLILGINITTFCFASPASSMKKIGTFNTISDMEKYAATLDEFPQPDLPDWENPDYTTYYKTITPTIYRTFTPAIAQQLLSTAGLARYAWNPTIFSTLLREAVIMREYAGCNGRFVQKITPSPGTSVIVFGELQGALHSLIRDLRSLQKQSLINENLFIEQPDCYIIFNGNTCSRSPYAMETLTIILQLLVKNPDRVIYIRGSQEDKERWMHYSLKRDLVNRAHMIEDSIIPLQDLLNKFFNTLPLAFYIVGSTSKKTIEVVRISNYGTEIKDKELQEKEFSDFFTNPSLSIYHVNQEARKRGPLEIRVRAIIRGEQYFRSQYLPSQGLQMSGKEEGATGWTIFSSPTLSYQMLFKFFHDAYAIVTTEQSFDNWIITLFNRNIKDNETIKPTKCYKLLTGAEVPPSNFQTERKKSLKQKIDTLDKAIANVDKSIKTIKIDKLKQEIALIQNKRAVKSKKKDPSINSEQEGLSVALQQTDPQKDKRFNSVFFGSTMDFSRPNKTLSIAAKNGIELALSTLPTTSLPLQFIAIDDTYDPIKARANVESLIKEYNATFILSPIGSANFTSFKDLLQIGSVVALFPLPGVAYKRTPENALKYCVYFRPSYEDEGTVLIRYIVSTTNPQKVAAFYQNDAFGKACLSGIITNAPKNLQILQISYERNDADFSKQVAILQRELPDCIILCATIGSATALLQQIPDSLLTKSKLFGISDLGETSFQKLVKEKKITCITTNAVPDPTDTKIPLVAQYNAVTAKANIPPNTWGLETFLTTKLTAEVINSVREITKDTVINYIEQIKNRDFYGIYLNFDPQTRQLSHVLWINEGTGPWQETSTLKLTAQTPGTPVELKSAEKRTLLIGCTADLTRNASVFSKPVIVGLESVFNASNARGGINGTTINLNIKNDEYLPEQARKNILNFLQDNIDTIILPVGSPTLSAYLDLVKDKKVLVLFPITGATTFRAQDLKYIVHARASYEQEGERLAQYALETLGAKKIAIFYQQDIEAIGSIKSYFKTRGFKNFLDLYYTRQATNFTQQVDEINKFSPDTIIFLAIPAAALELIRQIGIPNLAGKNLLGWSDLISEAFSHGIRQRGLKFITSSVVPNPAFSTLPIIQEYRKYAASQNFSLDCFSLEGFVGGKIFEEIIKKIDGPITKEKIIEVAEQFNNFDLSGIQLTFNPETRQLINSIWLDIGTEDWLEEKLSVKPITQPMTAPLIEQSAVSEKPIVIGSSLDLSRMNKDIGQAIKDGAELAFSGKKIGSRSIQFTVMDNYYNPETAKQNVIDLMKNYSCDIIFGVAGSENYHAIKPFADSGSIALLFSVTSDRFIPTQAPSKNCIFYRPAFEDEAFAITRHCIETSSPQKIIAFYQDDRFGRPMWQAVQKAINGKKITLIGIPYKSNDTNFTPAAAKIIKEKPDCIILCSVALAAINLMRQLNSTFILKTMFYGCSPLSVPSFQKLIKEKSVNIAITNVTPDPSTSNIPIIEEFRKIALEKQISITPFTVESYIEAKILIETLKDLQEAINKDTVIAGLEKIKNQEFEGIKLNFDTTKRQLSHTLWIDDGTGGPWKEVIVKTGDLSQTAPDLFSRHVTQPQLPEHEATDEPSTIVLGTTLDLSRMNKDVGIGLKEGANLAFANAKLHNKMIQYITLDDEFQPEKARANVLKLIDEYSCQFLINAPFSQGFYEYQDLIKDGKIAALFHISGIPYKRDATNSLKYCIYFRSSWRDETYYLTKYCIEKDHPQKIAAFYQNDLFGKGALDGIKSAAKGKATVIPISFERNDMNFEQQLQFIIKENPDCIILAATTPPATGLLRQLPEKFIRSIKWYAMSALSNQQFKKLCKEKQMKVTIINHVQDPFTSTIPIAQEFREKAQAQGISLTAVSFESYITASLLIDIINGIQGPITKDTVISALENIKNKDFKGILLNFNPVSRQLSNIMWLDNGSDEPWKEIKVENTEQVKLNQGNTPQETADKTAETAKPSKSIDSSENQPDKPIVVGLTADLSRMNNDLGREIKSGIELGLNNHKIGNKPITLTILDNEYDPTIARRNVLDFINKDKCEFLLCPLGVEIYYSIIDLVQSGSIASIFPPSGGGFARNQQNTTKYCVYFRPAYEDESFALTLHCLKTFKPKKVIAFYQNDRFGKALLRGIHRAMAQEKNSATIIEIAYERNDTNFSSQISQILAEKPDCIFLCTTSIAAISLLRELDAQQLRKIKIYGFSTLTTAKAQNFIKNKNINITLTHAVPDIKATDIPIVNEFHNLAQKAGIVMTSWSLEAYLCASIFLDALNSIKGPINKDSVISAIENIKNKNFKGIHLNFDPLTRQLSNKFWLDDGTDQPWEEISIEYKKESEKISTTTNELSKTLSQSPSKKLKEEIIGSSMDLSRANKDLSIASQQILNLVLTDTTIKDPLQCIILDDEYEPAKTRQNIKKLIADHDVDIALFLFGSANFDAIRDMVETGSIAALFPVPGTPGDRSGKNALKYCIHYRPSYRDEGYILAQYIQKKVSPRQIAVCYQDDPWGNACLAGVQKGLNNSVTQLIPVPLERNKANLEKAAQTLEKGKPDCVIFCTVPIAIKNLLNQLNKNFLISLQDRLYGVCSLNEPKFKQFLQEKTLKIITTNTVPDPKTDQSSIAQEYRQLCDKNTLKISTIGFEAYIAATLIREIITTIVGPVNKNSVIEALENIKNKDFRGINLNFDPITRQLSNSLWIDDCTGEPWKEVKFS